MNDEELRALYTDAIDAKVRAVVNTFTKDVSAFTAEDREDCLQEARLKCWSWIRENETETLGGGLTRLLATQACRDYERSTRKHRETEDLPDWHDPGEATDTEYEVLLGDIMSKIVNDDFEASVALLVIYEGLSVREAAEVMECHVTQVQRSITVLRTRSIELGIIPAGETT